MKKPFEITEITLATYRQMAAENGLYGPYGSFVVDTPTGPFWAVANNPVDGFSRASFLTRAHAERWLLNNRIGYEQDE
jgi:hypothetical protein